MTTGIIQNTWVWKNIDPSLADALVEFWLVEEALNDRQKAKARVPEVIMIAQDQQKNIVGITTMKIKMSEILGNEFCFWRQFVAKSMRQSRLASLMGIESHKILEEEFLKGSLSAKGLIVEVENPFMNDYLKSAILSPVPFIYFGHNTKGQQMRVCYFKGAKVQDF